MKTTKRKKEFTRNVKKYSIVIILRSIFQYMDAHIAIENDH